MLDNPLQLFNKALVRKMSVNPQQGAVINIDVAAENMLLAIFTQDV